MTPLLTHAKPQVRCHGVSGNYPQDRRDGQSVEGGGFYEGLRWLVIKDLSANSKNAFWTKATDRRFCKIGKRCATDREQSYSLGSSSRSRTRNQYHLGWARVTQGGMVIGQPIATMRNNV
jgi:hypothetical protein